MSKVLRETGFSRTAIRRPEDFYITPKVAIEELLKREKFVGRGWEPACGDGAISRFFSNNIHFRSSDIRRDKDIYGEKGVDFLKTYHSVDFIITNPLFSLILPFMEHAVECAKKKVALFGRIQLLESKKRYYFFKHHPPIRVYVFSSRVSCSPQSTKKRKVMCFAWFIWKIGYTEKPSLDWILIDR